ncbi:MAG: prenyltransferase [Sciscionella sp.]
MSDLWTEKTHATVTALLSDIASDSYGQVSSSIYETARVVTLAPWLTGHLRRVRFLLESQQHNGRWGGPDDYGLVPTLSATEALLATLLRYPGEHDPLLDYGQLVSAADRGLRSLFRWLGTDGRVALPDTVAVELVVPALVTEINAHLDRLGSEPVVGLDVWRGTARLVLPRGVDNGLLMRLRDAALAGHGLPTKLLHSLEVVGAPVRGASFVHPVQGAVGCSPAATATWLGDRAPQADDHPSVDYLVAIQQRCGGPVPVCAPVPLFEQAWVLAALTTAGVSVTVPRGLLGRLHAAFGEKGAAVGPGLPPDADDTSTALHALARLGSPHSPESLWTYQVGRHFSCFPAERTPSTTTNAHILQAFGACLVRGLPQHRRYRAAISELSGWLHDAQQADGSWSDKWHASGYYATACCAVALAEYGDAPAAVRKATEWVLATQRADGSWGRWAGTYEETAYAVQTLLRTGMPRADGAIQRAAARGCAFLLRSGDDQEHPALWHDKDLYTPSRVIRAEGLATPHLAHDDPRVAAMVALEYGESERAEAG